MKRRTAALLGAGSAVATALVVANRRVDRGPVVTVADGERTKVETSDGAQLVVDINGPAGGPTVVLAHCWGGDIANWAPATSQLVAEGHRVVRFYQRGHGPSTVGSDGFTIERFGADLAELLEALDLRDVVLAGHSLGGMATQSFAVHHSGVLIERVRALVLVATSSGDLANTPIGRSSSFLLNLDGMDRFLTAPYGHLFVRGALGRGATPAAVRATRDHFVATPMATRRGIGVAMLDMDLAEGIRNITVPVTVLAGGLDSLTPPAHSRRIAAAIPGAELVVVPTAGHMLPFEATGLVAETIAKHARSA